MPHPRGVALREEIPEILGRPNRLTFFADVTYTTTSLLLGGVRRATSGSNGAGAGSDFRSSPLRAVLRGALEGVAFASLNASPPEPSGLIRHHLPSVGLYVLPSPRRCADCRGPHDVVRPGDDTTRRTAGSRPLWSRHPAEVEQVIGTLKTAPSASSEGGAAWCKYEFRERAR